MRNCLTEARWQVFLLLWAVLLLAAGCGGEGPPLSPFTVDTIDGVWIEAKEGSVTSTGMELLLHNQAKREDLHYGVTFYLEEERDGQWYTCPPIPPHVPGTGPLIAYDILPDEQVARSGLEENSHTYDWTYSYGKLPPGNYRLLLEVSSALDAPTGIYPCYYLSAPFTVEPGARDPVGGVSIEAGDVSPTGMELIFHNPAEWEDLSYGLDFSLDWWKDTSEPEPYPVQEQEESVYWNAAAIRIPPGTSTHSIDWEWKYGALPPGSYCLTLYVRSDSSSGQGNAEGYPFLVTFHVTDKSD